MCDTAIEHEASAIFAGEPTGSRPNFIGEAIDFEAYRRNQDPALDDILAIRKHIPG